MDETYEKDFMILVARIGGVNVTLPIAFTNNLSNESKDYRLIDDTYIRGVYSDDGVFVIKIFNPKSEIMINVIKCMSLVTCYDFSKKMDAINPTEDDNMQVGRILKPTSEIKMWGR